MSQGNYLSGIHSASLEHFLYDESQAIQLATMDIFLDFYLFLIVEKQRYSFASARGIDRSCLELRCYTFLILTAWMRVSVGVRVCDVRLIKSVFNKNHRQIRGGGIYPCEGHT